MQLYAVDAGLMGNHLPMHQGTIAKLSYYLSLQTSHSLQLIVQNNLQIMVAHMKAMQQLLTPQDSGYVSLPPVQQLPTIGAVSSETDYLIALDGRLNAVSMAKEDFSSAMGMHTPMARNIHIEMALQKVQIAEQYEQFLLNAGLSVHPYASAEIQQALTEQYRAALASLSARHGSGARPKPAALQHA
ncbi:hypothetical protein LOK74_15680 [Brevibacillus humidisoli]|uniref:hypothetical protein n=1 Tax=Brevibacillus humidisoli TaxID=2895522 RepID=UPI001E3165B6|nr:hypothetical protein [Brevibacillus humidisoli]UFJ39489.1 hypothetical protein LOK74_15680 [Brevibacillus humidisoli]